MGVRILEGTYDGLDPDMSACALVDSVTNIMFGPLMIGASVSDVESFLEWLGEDPRKLPSLELDGAWYVWQHNVADFDNVKRRM